MFKNVPTSFKLQQTVTDLCSVHPTTPGRPFHATAVMPPAVVN